VASFIEERCFILYALTIFQLENVVVEIENFLFGQGMVVWLIDKVVPYFDDIVAEVNMTIN